jgi:CCR4-NOT transcriptional regulation complex NOT5 subunit
MFFLGVAVTLFGVYLLSKRDMQLLKPIRKLRAAVQMVIFLKRTQKCKHINYQWTVPDEKDHKKNTSVIETTKTCSNNNSTLLVGTKISKASVIPIHHNASTTNTSISTTTMTTMTTATNRKKTASIHHIQVAPPKEGTE